MGVRRYFDAFPITDYQFGDEKFNIPIQNLAIYADVIDQVRRTAATYQNYDVLPGERPDQVSYKLYGTTDYHWTFFLMNDKLRERGWPLSPLKAEELAKKEYKERIVTTQTSLISNCEVGTAVIGTLSGATGTVVHRDINLGQLWLDNSSTTLWTAGETINSTNATGIHGTIVLANLTNTIRAGLQAGATGDVTVNISTCRATGHDFLDIGTGGFNATNNPNFIIGPPGEKKTAKEL